MFRRYSPIPLGAQMVVRFMCCLILCGAAISCDDSKKAGSKDKAAAKTGPSYRLKITPPTPGKVGETVHAVVQLLPQGPYKVNEEYPLRLTVKGPQGKVLVMRSKDAKTATKATVVLHPKAVLTAPGEHTYKAEFRFSVCTEQQCELKREEISWVAKAN